MTTAWSGLAARERLLPLALETKSRSRVLDITFSGP